MLNMRKVKLEFIPDPDIFMFFGKCMRGRVSYISNRHGKANNNYVKEIHRILEFNQSQWLKPYVEFNTQNQLCFLPFFTLLYIK